jgi:hypothetical protein
MSEITKEETKILEEVKKQIDGLLEVNIGSICSAAQSFESEDESFAVSLKSKIKHNGNEAKIESEITIPGLRTKDNTASVVLDLRDSALL